MRWKLEGVSYKLITSQNAVNFAPLTAKIGPEFSPALRKLCAFRNLMATLTAYTLRMIHGIDNLVTVLETTGGVLPHVIPKQYEHEHWSINGLRLDLGFYPPSENSAIFFIAALRTCTSDHRTQPNFATVGVNNGKNYRSFHPLSAKYAFCFVARRCTRQTEPNTLCQTGRGEWRYCEANKVAPYSECK